MARRAADFNCSKCKFQRHCDDANPAPFPMFKIDGVIVIESHTCFLPMITPQSRFLLRMYQHYKNRLLPYEGGLLSQPNYYLEAMEIIARIVEQPDGQNQG